MNRQSANNAKKSRQRAQRMLTRLEAGTVAELLCMEHRQPFLPIPGTLFESGHRTKADLKLRCLGCDSEIAPKDALHPTSAQPFDLELVQEIIRREAQRQKSAAEQAHIEAAMIAVTARQEWEQILKPLTPRPAPVVYVHPDTP